MSDDTNNFQYNTAADGGTQYNAQGDQYIYEQVLHLFEDGLDALKNMLYPNAVEKFEGFLSTARDGRVAPAEEKIAKAHVLAALALLSASPPAYLTPEAVQRINVHLKAALDVSAGLPVYAQAAVLWAIVKEDYYEADGMPAPAPAASELRRHVGDLVPDEAAPLARHLAPARGGTWRALSARVRELGLEIQQETPFEETRRVEPGRAAAVKKYFTPIPDKKDQVGPAMLLCGAALAAIVGFIIGGFAVLLGLVGAFLLARPGVRGYLAYQEYLRKYAEAMPKVPDPTMDKWLAEDVDYIKKKAARRLRLNARLKQDSGDLVVPEQVVVGFPSSASGGGHKIRVRRGDDGDLRANAYDVLILLLTDGLVSSYGCRLDFETGDIVYDHTQEYHYKDIVGISSVSKPMAREISEHVELIGGVTGDFSVAKLFSLSVTSGESLTVETGYSGTVQDANGNVAWAGNAHALNIIQRMVRARHAAS